jgi:pimeloyl-ACP methyl ester carboxylesterase
VGSVMGKTAESRFYTSDDGLNLHYRDVAARDGSHRLPVICLPGLGRSVDDFGPLCEALAHHSETPRRMLAFDYRGRGLSDHDPDWRHYDMETERNDVLKALAQLSISRAHFIGTSRGGLHILGLAATHREMIASAVFNDIGPVLELSGLRRIKGYIGKSVAPRNLDEAVAILKIGGGQHFDGLTPDEWQHFATTTFGSDESALGLRYDMQLARALDAFDLDKPLPDSWPLFDKLDGAPVLTIRGANSDLLSDRTLAAMGARWAASQVLTVPGQGHAPLLADAATLSRIDGFLASAD